MIVISKDLGVILDEDYKLVGEARTDVAEIDAEPITKAIDELELLSRDLLRLLDHKGASFSFKWLKVCRPSELADVAIGLLLGLLPFLILLIIKSVRGA